MYRVNEIFFTLHGEGAHSGIPAVFVRFSGCNLKCPWCDTEFAEYTEMTTEEITVAWRLLYALGKDGDNNYYRDLLTENGKMRLRDILKPEAYDYFLQILDTNPDYATQPVVVPEGEGLMKDLYLD